MYMIRERDTYLDFTMEKGFSCTHRFKYSLEEKRDNDGFLNQTLVAIGYSVLYKQ